MGNRDIDVRRGNDLERFFGDRFGSLLGDWPMSSARNMPVEIRESDQGYMLCADIPGIPPEKVDVHVSGNMLTIHAENREEKSEGEEYSRQFRSFDQNFSLPSNVDADQIEADVENGVLQVFIPKTQQTQPRKIEMKSKGGGFLNRFRGKSADENQNKDRLKEKH